MLKRKTTGNAFLGRQDEHQETELGNTGNESDHGEATMFIMHSHQWS